jgi:hypothetical protein
LTVEELGQRDVPSAGLLAMQGVLLPGHQPGGVTGDYQLSSFQWGVGRGISPAAPAPAVAAPTVAAPAVAADAHWIELSSFQWGVSNAALPVESISFNFTKIE